MIEARADSRAAAIPQKLAATTGLANWGTPMVFRIATWNLENLDEDKLDQNGEPRSPLFEDRAEIIVPSLNRLKADVICFQEINGQERQGQPRSLISLQTLLDRSRYHNYKLVSTTLVGKTDVYDERNLVIAYRPELTLIETRQIKHDPDVLPSKPIYKIATVANSDPKELSWERPLLYASFRTPAGDVLHVLNVHFKSKLPTNIEDQKVSRFVWKSAGGWAEGFFLSSIRRVGAALEARVFLDQIFASAREQNDPEPMIVICGDFNADSDEVPVMAIRGRVEETGNSKIAHTQMFPCENTIPESSRYTLFHHGRGEMIDHLLISRGMLQYYCGAEIHNEVLTDESIAFRGDSTFPAPDHAAVVALFDYDVAPPPVA